MEYEFTKKDIKIEELSGEDENEWRNPFQFRIKIEEVDAEFNDGSHVIRNHDKKSVLVEKQENFMDFGCGINNFESSHCFTIKNNVKSIAENQTSLLNDISQESFVPERNDDRQCNPTPEMLHL